MSKKVQEAFKKDGFSASEITKRGWKNFDQKLTAITELYTSKEVYQKLLQNDLWKTFLGRSGNRVAAKYDLKLYKSIFEYTKILETASNRNLSSFSSRLRFIIEHNFDDSEIRCRCGKIRFTKFCEQCSDERYPTKKWFQKAYPDNWEDALRDFVRKQKFIRNYSKRSQELFWKIYILLPAGSLVYFAELNHEFYLSVTETENKLNRKMIFVDFLYKNKIIEFDGTHWHKQTKEYDDLRDKFTASQGYQTLRITEQEFASNSEATIQKCIKWLKS